jgi:phosphoesterase RecJ-like protein
MKSNLLDQAVSLIKNKNRFLLTTHVNPDGDGIGSSLALGEILKMIGKEIVYYCESPIPPKYLFLPGVDQFTKDLDDSGRFDVAVVIDCGDLKQVGDMSVKVERIKVVINIDHHITNHISGQLGLVDAKACASAEITYRLIKKLGHPITLPVALNLYTAILTDTGSFRFSNTNRAAFQICDEMIGLGVVPHVVAQQVYGMYSEGRLRLLNEVLKSLEISSNKIFAMVTVTLAMMAKTETGPEDIDGFVDYPRFLKRTEFSALIQEIGHNKFHVSLRSKGKVDVAGIAERFGGGGHLNASGFNVEGTLDWVKTQLFQVANSIDSLRG